MKQTHSNEAGFLIIKIILLVVVMVMGYVVISNVLESDEGQDAVNTVNSAKEQADKVLR